MAKAKKGPYACVMIASVREKEPGSKTSSICTWRPWLIDLGALDMLSPPWLRKGREASMTDHCETLEAFGEHCVKSMRLAAPLKQASVRMKREVSVVHGVAMVVLMMRFPHAEDASVFDAEEGAMASVAVDELRKLTRRSKSETRSVARVWADAPEACSGYWTVDIVGFETGGKSGHWAPELASALQANELDIAIPQPATAKARAKSL